MNATRNGHRRSVQPRHGLAQLLEDFGGLGWDWMDPFLDNFSAMQFQRVWPYPFSTPFDRRYGQLYPLVRHETQLALYRAPSRLMSLVNPYARGLLAGFDAYVGPAEFKFRATAKADNCPPELVKKVQDIMDAFIEPQNEAIQWPLLASELFIRRVVDGEYFLRHWQDPDTGECLVKSTEPELIYDSQGRPDTTSFGIHTPADNTWKVEWYEQHLLHNPPEIDWVPAADMVHYKNPMLPRGVKRGLPEFTFGTYDALTQADKLANALGVGGTVLAAIPYIRQHATASAAAVSAFQQGEKDWAEESIMTGKTVDTQRIEVGQVHDIPAEMTYVEPPGGAMIGEPGIAVLHMLARRGGQSWNAPEWLATASGGDMAAYTASLTAQNPFVKKIKKEQSCLAPAFLRTMRIVIEYAIERKELPTNTLDRPGQPGLVKILCETPDPTHQDRIQQAQENQILIPLGVKSRQKAIQEYGDDPEQVEQENQEWQEANGPAVPGLELPADEEAKQGDREPPAPRPAMPTMESLLESYLLEAGFTGTDAHGHKWINGKQVKKGEEPGPGLKKKANFVAPQHLARARQLARQKGKATPVPSAQEVAFAHEQMDKVGAADYEMKIRGNSSDRAASRKRLLEEFGDGKVCPCVYCGLKLDDGSVTRDKILTARQGGRYKHANLVPACLACNQSRSDTPWSKLQWK